MPFCLAWWEPSPSCPHDREKCRLSETQAWGVPTRAAPLPRVVTPPHSSVARRPAWERWSGSRACRLSSSLASSHLRHCQPGPSNPRGWKTTLTLHSLPPCPPSALLRTTREALMQTDIDDTIEPILSRDRPFPDKEIQPKTSKVTVQGHSANKKCQGSTPGKAGAGRTCQGPKAQQRCPGGAHCPPQPPSASTSIPSQTWKKNRGVTYYAAPGQVLQEPPAPRPPKQTAAPEPPQLAPLGVLSVVARVLAKETYTEGGGRLRMRN
ncbi:uncharacterized protein LOC125160783 [Prionailurus viverrinus]|uniref:uncharacterized protein LOC125160783 n=1 Tax=Prionailurus viverrinus TaxID=61388 RepID=UPI001FF0E785|nr:uncharacterized protein LOC125160783 [Prionailurus viverrinus]